VLGTALGSEPTAIGAVAGLWGLNIDPEQAAYAYRERVVGPYRGVLPMAAITSMEEQLSGACTVEIAAFDEFSKLLGDKNATARFEHIVFDTAPTGHTLRLLELPAAWTDFIDSNVGGTSCLGPLSGLAEQKELYAASGKALRDPMQTTLVLVARPERSSLAEADRTRGELAALGVCNVQLIVNGVFKASDRSDSVANAMDARGRDALAELPSGLQSLMKTFVPLLPFGVLGVEALRAVGGVTEAGHVAMASSDVAVNEVAHEVANELTNASSLETLVDDLAKRGKGVVMTMGKGGVGKTTIAARIARALAFRGHDVTLTTTDPAAHVQAAVQELGGSHGCLRVTRIDPIVETKKYSEDMMLEAGSGLDAQGKALLQEDLRSPCTEEIAVFRAFSDTVAQGESRFVVIDTAPTGHTLLLLDAAESYHREVLKKKTASPQAVQSLLPRLRDAAFTSVLLVTLPEATPIHEAMQLEEDLIRAQIKPLAWVVNQSLVPLTIKDPLLASRRLLEVAYLREITDHAARVVLEAWSKSHAIEPSDEQVKASEEVR